MKKTYIIAFIMIAVIFSPLFAGGGQQASGGSTASSNVNLTGLPIVNNTITIRALSETRNDRTMSNTIKTIQELEKRTNIHIEWEALPTVTTDRDAKFNAVIASGDIPDLIDGLNNPTVINNYGMQGVLMNLKPLINQYGPNITNVFNNPIQGDLIPYSINVWGEITAINGNIYNIPIVSASNAIGAIWAIRTDWLSKLGLSIPSNVDELYTALKAFKNGNPSGSGKGDEIPFASAQGNHTSTILAMVPAFDAHMNLYVDPVDNTIKFGPVEPQFKEALTFLNKLYSEGLIEKDYLTATNDQWLARAGGNQVGLEFVWPGSGLAASNNELQKINPDYHFEPFPPIKSATGKQYKDTFVSGAAIAYRTSVSAKTKYPVEIMRLLDYCFSPEGERLASWGIEGQTYTMVNGQPQFNDYIMKNPGGLDPETAQIQFGIRWNMLPYQNAWAPNFQSMGATAPWTVQAWKVYQQPGLVEAPMPTLGLTEDELSRRQTLITDINTFKDPLIDKFIMGQEPLSNFDNFVAGINRAGLSELLTMLNKAYDVYKANM
ncbi:MAG: extracellular solute-binding protein [Treponema sp.]|nr:extracellular solute-binding protein [Treponema sp.]